jgi:photosystem II stability/assembly factor-like uncharacterized protein
MYVHPAVPGRMYQQNHVGVYRSDDAGDSWYRIDKGLPYDYGFGLALNPNDAESCFVVPLCPEEYAFRATSGALKVYALNGRTWKPMGKGLPAEGAHVTVLREGLASDSLNPCGVYLGTENGQVFQSADEGRTWLSLATYLPPVLSVSIAVV